MSNGISDLVGKSIMAPASLWPDYPPPKGKSGWEGTVVSIKSKSPELLYVKFPGDPSKYFFEAKDVRCWLVTEGSKATAEAKKAGKTPAKKAEDDKPESSKAAGKKRQADAERPASPQKREKAAAGPSPRKATKETLTAELDPLIDSMSTSQLSRLLEEARKIAK